MTAAKRKRILVIGGAGFVGRELVRTLLGQADVLVADILRYGAPDWLVGELDGFSFRHLDIRDAVAVGALIHDFRPDTVVHLAAIHYIPECDADPALAVSTNVSGTVNLLAACPTGTRFVFASSGAVYAPDDMPHGEFDSALGPADIYGITKLHAEQYVRAFAADGVVDGCIVRLFNVIGPGETSPHLLPEIVAQLRDNVEAINLGNTWPKRDYSDVLDAARGFAAAALGNNAEGVDCEVVNLGSGQQYSVDEILERIRSVLGLSFEVRRDPKRMRVVDRPFLGADISHIKAVLDWSPVHQLDATLKRTWAQTGSISDFGGAAPLRRHLGTDPSTSPQD